MTTPSAQIAMTDVETALNEGISTNYTGGKATISFNDNLVRRLVAQSTTTAADRSQISMSQMRSKAGPKPINSVISSVCSGSTLVTTNADGKYGSTTTNTLNSSSCIVAGNFGTTTSTTWTVPASSGGTLKILCIGSGGGGGGGTGRSAVYPYTGGGGGGSGEITLKTISVAIGTVLTITVGAAGSAGNARDGIYSGGSSGSAGGGVQVKNGTTVIAGAGGGGGGGVSQQPPNTFIADNYSIYFGQNSIDNPGPVAGGGAGGSGGNGASGYTNPFSSEAGEGVGYSSPYPGGGYGGRGYNVDATVGIATPYSTGSRGAGGRGNAPPQVSYSNGTYWFASATGCKGNGGSNTYPTTGTTYGAGGGGGGIDNEYCGTTDKIYGRPGSVGGVFIYWGY